MSDLTVEIVDSINRVPSADWDTCADATEGRPYDPFTTHRFLKALEDSGSVGRGTGWQPAHVIARAGEQIIGCSPVYAKSHSQGEYIFDFNWANAYENAGGQYYPKLQCAVPFTPATGRRFLIRNGFEKMGQSALLQGMVQLAAKNEFSSLHITFCTEPEAAAGEQMGLLRRTSQQFHWLNDGYKTFDDFLSALSSRKRKNIRKERARANAFGGEIHLLQGKGIHHEHWDAFWEFYQDTGSRKWGTPYLTRDFFDCIHETMRDDVLLLIAERNGRPIAGALNFIGRDTLFGRYWGCNEDHPCLHFEACYYRAIDYAIKHGLARIEAGAQGEHKLARGYLPVTTHSLHWIADEGFRQAIAQYLEAEAQAVGEDIEILTDYGPFKKE